MAPTAQIKSQWAENQRLRLAVLVIVLILAWSAIDTLENLHADIQAQTERNRKSLEQLRSTEQTARWPELAEQAKQRKAKLEALFDRADTPGLAQADQQSWLGNKLQALGLEDLSFDVGPAENVTNRDSLWRLNAHIQGPIQHPQLIELLWALENKEKSIRIERLLLKPIAHRYQLEMLCSIHIVANTNRATGGQ